MIWKKIIYDDYMLKYKFIPKHKNYTLILITFKASIVDSIV